MAVPAAIELVRVSKRYGQTTAVNNVSLRLVPGEVLCLLGENGAGKTTIIKMLTGVEPPTSGEILVDGAPARFTSPRDALDRGIATVYQEVGTLPLMSVGRNFVLGTEPTVGRGVFRRLDLATANRIAIREMAQLGIRQVNSGSQLVGTLSGGERQALAIGRALHFGARVLVLDEPTAALGIRESATVLQLVNRVRERQVAVLLITHNAYHADAIGDRFLVIRRGEVIADFARGGETVERLMELMAGGEEFDAAFERRPM
jgi:simple sugar transport system ATP-binding protein